MPFVCKQRTVWENVEKSAAKHKKVGDFYMRVCYNDDVYYTVSAQKFGKKDFYMATYDIITDSSSDISAKMAQELGVRVAPLMVNFRGETYPDTNDDSLKDFYAGLRNGEMASTSAVNPETWCEVIRPTLEAGKDAVVITFSSALSTTYQSAVIAATDLMDEFPKQKVYICDSLCASMGQNLLVWYACRERDKGATAVEVVEWIELHKKRICHFFTVDDLDFLKRGGRIGAATAAMGSMLNIKPILRVNTKGELVELDKVRGRKAAGRFLIDKLDEQGAGKDDGPVFISHGDCLEEAEAIANVLKTKYNVKEVVIGYIGAVIGAHAGPGTLALFFMGNSRK